MLARNTGSQTCWVVFLGSYSLAHGYLSFCIPPKTAQLRASASDETEATAVRAEVWEGNRIRSRRENPQVWWEGAGWFGMHRVELCLEADANYDSHLPPSFHDFYLRTCSTSSCFWHDLPLDIASPCIPPQIRDDDKELGEEKNVQDREVRAKFYKMAIYMSQKFFIRVSTFTNVKYIFPVPQHTSFPKSVPVHSAHFTLCVAS